MLGRLREERKDVSDHEERHNMIETFSFIME